MVKELHAALAPPTLANGGLAASGLLLSQELPDAVVRVAAGVLQRLERRAALRIDRDDLAVDDRGPRLQLSHRLGDLRIGAREVAPLGG